VSVCVCMCVCVYVCVCVCDALGREHTAATRGVAVWLLPTWVAVRDV